MSRRRGAAPVADEAVPLNPATGRPVRVRSSCTSARHQHFDCSIAARPWAQWCGPCRDWWQAETGREYDLAAIRRGHNAPQTPVQAR